MMQSQDFRITAEDRAKHDAQFYQLKPAGGFITGEQARGFFLQSGLPKNILGHIWSLADMNGDGKMDKLEFSIAMYLIKRKLQGAELPKTLPPSLQQSPSPAMGGFGGSFTMGTSGQMMGQSGSGGFQGVTRSATLPHTGTQPVHASPERSSSMSSSSEWSIPHGPKLRYKQVFNTNDKTRSGFLTGPQARQILLQTGLTQSVLAQIWGLADIDNDGRLTQDEFCVAMHLADMAKVGQTLPATLPMNLVPPSFRRGRSGSATAPGTIQPAVPMSTMTSSMGTVAPSMGTMAPSVAPSMGTMAPSMGTMAPSMGTMPGMVSMPGAMMGMVQQPMVPVGGMMMPMAAPMSPGLPQQQSFDEIPPEEPMGPVSFEDKKKKNFEKGQMELERRRAMLREEQQREKDRQLQIEKQEQEKKERIRMEQERRRQMELDRMLARQRELEAEQEEQRRKMIEQREAARRELERQRQLEIQRQRRQELEAQRIRHQEDVCHLKSKSKTLACELETLEDKKNSLNKQLSDAKNTVTEHHTTIILMGQSRDSKVTEIERLQKAIQEQRQVKMSVDMQKDDISEKAKKLGIDSDISENYRTVMRSFQTKKNTVERLREQLKQHENAMETTLLDVDAQNSQITELKEKIPKEQAELDRLTAVHQQKQHSQQHTVSENRRLQQIAASNEQKLKIAAEQKRIRDENQQKMREEEERRKQEQIRLAQQKEEADRIKKEEEKKVAASAASAPSVDLFAGFGSGADDPFAKATVADDLSSKQLDPSDPFAAFKVSGSAAAVKPSSDKEDPFGAFADFSNATFDFGPPKESQAAAQPSVAPRPAPKPSQTQPSITSNLPSSTITASTATTTKAEKPPVTAPKPNLSDNGVPSKSPVYKTSGVLFLRYKALYPFVAETPEELTINPGDIIMVGKSENAEPGWLGGELNGKTGWFPENYAEKLPDDDGEKSTSSMGWASFGNTDTKQSDDDKSESTLAPSSSAFSQPAKSSPFAPVTPSVSQQAPSPTPTPGQGKILPAGTKAEALYDWDAKKDNHLSFKKGDILSLTEQQDMWWLGELNGKQGWFPKTQVKQLPEDKPVSAGVSVPTAKGSVAAIASSLFGNAAAPTITNTPVIAPAPAAATAPVTQPAASATPAVDQTQEAEEYQALYPYTSDEPGDLTFAAGDVIHVTKKEGDWLTGSIGGRQGIFPANCVQLKGSTSPQAQTDTPVNSFEQSAEQSSVSLDEVITKFPYSSDQPDDLSFGAGETIVVTKKDGDWWTGRIGDKEGIFPANYVTPKGGSFGDTKTVTPTTPTVAVTAEEAATKTASLTRKPEIARVIAPYTATSEEQLSLSLGQLIGVRKKNPSGWWEGELQARGKKKQIGWFPANYVQLMGSSGAPTGGTTPVDSSMVSQTAMPVPSQGIERAVSPTTPTSDAMCQVITLYPYTKQNEDELSFQKGMVVNVVSKEDKDWWKGELNGLTGVFPANYVQELSESSRSNDIN